MVAIVEIHTDTGADIAVLDTASDRVTTILNSKFDEQHPEISPDDRWIGYTSNESKKRQKVYVRPFPGPGRKVQVSNEGGSQPLWARNGKRLFYRSRDQVWVVDVQAGGEFNFSNRHMVFEKSGYGGSQPLRGWDLSHDGQRFLMFKLEQRKPTPVTEMILVQNWSEELKQQVPTGNK